MQKKIPNFILRCGYLLLSIVLVVYSVRNNSFLELSQNVLNAEPLLILLGLVIISTSWLLAAQKLKILFPTNQRLTLMETFRLLILGNAAGYILPGSHVSSEITKITLLKTDHAISIGYSAQLIIIDKILGLTSFAILGFFLHFFSPLKFSIVIWICGSIIIGVMLFIFQRKTISTYRLGNSFFIQRLRSIMAITEIPSSILITNLSLAIVSNALLLFGFYLFAQSISMHIPLATFLYIAIVCSIAISLPISFAGIGVREFSYTYLLGMLNISQTKSLVFTSLLYIPLFFTIVIAAVLIHIKTKSYKKLASEEIHETSKII